MTDMMQLPPDLPDAPPEVPPAPAAADWFERPLAAWMTFNWERALYATLIILAVISRFAMLGDRVVSHDESLHTQFSYQYYNGEGYQYQALMHGPFLFHATSAAYWLFGVSDFTSRVPVALLGIIIVAMPLLLRDWLGRRGALFASFFFLISPYITYYSRYIRHDIYVITWALIVFISMVHYLRRREDKYLWWFAAGTALMFSTKEVSFLYVAIFGSFLVVRLLSRIALQQWLRSNLGVLVLPLAVLLAGLVLTGTCFLALARFEDLGTLSQGTLTLLHWGQIIGLMFAVAGLFLGARALRVYLDAYPEFDLVIMFSSLLMPTLTAGLTILAGGDPLSTARPACAAYAPLTRATDLGSALRYLGGLVGNFGRTLTSADCLQAALTAPLVLNTIFLLLTLGAGFALGWWWGGRRWLIAAGVFHAIFGVLYTSLFSNIQAGWVDGMIESLGYWFAQQEVARGGQPPFYYFLVVPFYEFLVLGLALAGSYLWFRLRKLEAVADGLLLLTATGVAFSFGNWLLNRPMGGPGVTIGALLLTGLLALAWVAFQVWRRLAPEARTYAGAVDVAHAALTTLLLVRGIVVVAQTGLSGGARTEPTALPGLVLALAVLALGALYWWLVRRPRLVGRADSAESPTPDPSGEPLLDTIAFLIWWMVMTWAVYSYAGEKMPWLSTHFVIPMAFLAGWFLNNRLRDVSWRRLTSMPSLLRVLLALIALFSAALVLRDALITIDGTKTLPNLTVMGQLYGRLLIAVVAVAGLYLLDRQRPHPSRRYTWLVGGLVLFSLMTIRSNYLATFVNFDNANEFMVYAHGGPGTKSIALRQLETLSLRLYGDKSIKVGYDNDVSWPFTWYLWDYPNEQYFADSPSPNVTNNEVLIVGNDNWGKVDAIVGDQYEYTTFSYLQWPIEDYRNFSWGAFLGIPSPPNAADLSPEERAALFTQPRGLTSRNVRAALWDIWIHRDYTAYGEVFGKSMALGRWPVRDEARIYVRKDVLAQLWDYGATEIAYTPPTDPYAGGQLTLAALQAIGQPGSAEGQLLSPRDVAVGADGTIYVADSGNHRVQVFDADGRFVRSFGGFGSEPGQFNEPWGIAVDELYIYVADTWNWRLQRFTLNGTLVNTIGTGGSPSEGSAGGNLYFGPRDIVLLPDNRLLVADTGNHRLQLLTRDGQFIDQVGGFGAELGKLYEPVGLAQSPGGAIFVADTWNRRVQMLTNDLVPVRAFTVDGWKSESLNNKPYLAIDSRGHVLVTDPEGYRVLVFDASGQYIGRFGTFGSDLAGGLNIPNGIAVTADDRIVIADSANNRVLVFPALPDGLVPAAEFEPPAGADPLLLPPGDEPPAQSYPDP